MVWQGSAYRCLLRSIFGFRTKFKCRSKVFVRLRIVKRYLLQSQLGYKSVRYFCFQTIYVFYFCTQRTYELIYTCKILRQQFIFKMGRLICYTKITGKSKGDFFCQNTISTVTLRMFPYCISFVIKKYLSISPDHS